jgi:hypothetical protein
MGSGITLAVAILSASASWIVGAGHSEPTSASPPLVVALVWSAERLWETVGRAFIIASICRVEYK